MSNIPMIIIDLSVDEDIKEIKRPHIRKTVDPKWFDDYPWLETESVNGNTMLFCKICRECNGITTFARGTPLLRIDKIRDHMRTSEHKNLKNHLNQMLQDN